MKTIRWCTFTRDELPEALFGDFPSSTKKYLKFPINTFKRKSATAVVGYSDTDQSGFYSSASLIVLDDIDSLEFFSWLNTYANETFPLSQFARVSLLSDWEDFPNSAKKEKIPQRTDFWSSVIIGEALAQGETNIALEDMPLSRAASCFSTAMARTSIIHGDFNSTRECVKRLKLVENDRRFARRTVSVDELKPVWSLVSSQSSNVPTADEAATLVFDVIRSSQIAGNNSAFPNDSFELHPELFSDSIEKRVTAFHQLTSEILIPSMNKLAKGSLIEVTLAAAAFLVGRGTQHSFLLNPYFLKYPATYVWFGLIAALAGPKSWDLSWSRGVKSVEKTLRTSFDWSDPLNADLSWAEFSWIANTFEGEKGFISLPKLSSRALSIEVVPGAICQFRLESGKERLDSIDSLQKSKPSANEEELKALLHKFVTLADHASSLIKKSAGPFQQSLNFDESTDKLKQSPDTRKVKYKKK